MREENRGRGDTACKVQTPAEEHKRMVEGEMHTEGRCVCLCESQSQKRA